MKENQVPGDRERAFFWLGVGALVMIVAGIIRLAAYPIVVSDYTYFLAKWFLALQSHPWLSAFSDQFSDYSPLYLYFLKLLTFIPVSSLYSIKTLSLLFDTAIAAIAALIVRKTQPNAPGYRAFLAFACLFAAPTILINSSLWGQADAPYAAGIALCLYFILSDRPLFASLAFAFAFCLKVQSVFFLPVLIGYLLRKDGAWWYAFLIPLAYILSVIPAWLGGGSFWYWLTIYAHQATEYGWLNVSGQSVYAFTAGLPLSAGFQGALFWAGLALAAIIAVLVVAAIAYPHEPLKAEYLLSISLLCVVAVPFLLPRMHERYFYLADMLSIIYAAYNPRGWYLPVLIVLSSFLSYMPFLSPQVSWFGGFTVDLRFPAAILFVALVLLVAGLFLGRRERKVISA